MKLSFHGAARGVTGSCHLLETSKGKILIDCGLFQGEHTCGTKNFADFGFDPTTIDAVIITHAHLDHIGRLPHLIKHGFRGNIFMTSPTKSLTRLVLDDAYRLMIRESEKCGSPVLYEEKNIKAAEEMFVGRNYHTEFSPIEGVNVMFSDAGHILGSAFVNNTINGSETKNGEEMKIVFSGDIGNDNVPILDDTEEIFKADIIVSESTYGDRDHEPSETRKEVLTEFIKRIIGRKGTIIVPAFSIERTQELLYELDELIDTKVIPQIPIYLDSPLAIKTTQVYRDFKTYLRFDRALSSSPDNDFFSFPRLRETLSIDESKKINDDKRSKMIIAGSGMMTGGRVIHHLKRYLSDENSGVLIIGYQAEHTLGRRVQDKVPKVRIYESDIPVRVDVEKIEAFSAHGDRRKLKRWLLPKEGEVKKIFLVHGDLDAKASFKKYLEKERTSEIIIPKFHEEFEF